MKPATINATTAAVAIALVAGALALGLTAGDDSPPESAPTAAATSASPVESAAPVEEAPVPVVEEVAAPVVGQVITAEQAEDLPEGQLGFVLSDGTIVVVQADQPLPEVIRSEVAAESAAMRIPGKGWATDDRHRGHIMQTGTRTGKKIIIIAQAYFSLDGVKYEEMWLAVKQQEGRIQATADINVTMANAQAFVAAQPDPAMWEIIVMNH